MNKKDSDAHSLALTRFDTIQSAVRDERMQCLKDRRFYSIAGAQWEGPLAEQYENKPKMEFNKIHLAIIRIISEYRNNRITVDFLSKDGSENDRMADECDALYRASEDDSTANEAYDNAFEEALGGGFGALRVRNDYVDDEDEEDERQKILIDPIFDADSSVFFDLQAKRQDKADAGYAFVVSSMTREAYTDEYGDDPASWPKEIHQHEFDWLTPDLVYIAEYFVVEREKRKLYTYKALSGETETFAEDELEDELERLNAIGAVRTKTRTIKRRRVRKYIMSGNSILEDCGHIAGSNIPVIPMYGKRWFVDGIERCMGHVRLARDAQMLANMQKSKLAEISSLGSVSKPILTPSQIAGHKLMWQDDNIKNYPYLLINPVIDANGNKIPTPPVAYTKTAEVPQALAALIQMSHTDMDDLLGSQQAAERVEGNVSTDTMMIVQNNLEMQTFIYMSNMAKTIKRVGEIWLGMAKEIYVEEGRKLRGLGSAGESRTVELLKPTVNDNGETVYENDLSKADYDVVVSVGPSSTTKRAATVRSLTNMAQVATDPETRSVLSAMMMMNMDGEGVSDAKEFFRKKLVTQGVITPSPEEAAEIQAAAENQQPTPEDQYLQQLAIREQSEAEKNQAEIISEQADADKTRAQTQEILQGIDINKLKAISELVEKMGPRIEPTLNQDISNG